MAELVYPPSLPCPQRAPYTRAERRALSAIPGLRRTRTLWRDRLGREPVQFLLTFAQTLTWREWVSNDLIEGGAWFAADWRQPFGRTGVFRFIEAPSYPEFIPLVGWRVTAVMEVRGRGMAPQGAHVVSDAYFANVGYLLHFDNPAAPQVFPDVKLNVWSKQTPNPTYDGQVAVSGTIEKFGAGSLAIQTATGTTANYTLLATSVTGNYSLGTGNKFTLEAWVFWGGNIDSRISAGEVRDSGGGMIAEIRMYTAGQFVFKTDLAAPDDRIVTMPTGQWVHLAMTYDGTTKRWFINGALTGAAAISAGATKTVSGYRFQNIASGNGAAPIAYIDDARFTFSVARYTAAFTPPTLAFPDQGP